MNIYFIFVFCIFVLLFYFSLKYLVWAVKRCISEIRELNAESKNNFQWLLRYRLSGSIHDFLAPFIFISLVLLLIGLANNYLFGKII